jgi:uncharacterized YccA/Bax inhibitor family protein
VTDILSLVIIFKKTTAPFPAPVYAVLEGLLLGAISVMLDRQYSGIAALNLVMDFDFVESGAARGAPKFMEWSAAFGLLVTLIWLYLEILRLLAKTQKR